MTRVRFAVSWSRIENDGSIKIYWCPQKIDKRLVLKYFTMNYDTMLKGWLTFQQFQNLHHPKENAL